MLLVRPFARPHGPNVDQLPDAFFDQLIPVLHVSPFSVRFAPQFEARPKGRASELPGARLSTEACGGGLLRRIHIILIPLLSCAHPMLRFVRNTAPKSL